MIALFIETFFLLLAVAVFLLGWGWKSKNTGVFFCGGLMVSALGLMLYATGLTTTNPTALTTTKMTIDGNTVFQTAITLQTIMVDQDQALQIASFAMVIVGALGTFIGFTFLKKKG